MTVCKNCGKTYEGEECPECGEKNDAASTNVCSRCGKPLSGKGTTCMSCRRIMQRGGAATPSTHLNVMDRYHKGRDAGPDTSPDTPIELLPAEELELKAVKEDPEAKCELAKRCLSGLLGTLTNTDRAKKLFAEAAKLGNKQAESVVSALKVTGEKTDDVAMMFALGKWFEEKALDTNKIPKKEQEFSISKKLAIYWLGQAIAKDDVSALYEMAEFYYLLGDKDNENAAVLFTYCAGIEGEYADKSLDRLYTMFKTGWMKEGWNCYPDAVFVLDEYSDYDVSEYKVDDEELVVDDVTAEKLIGDDPPYPYELKDSGEKKGDDDLRALRKVLLSMGITSRLSSSKKYRIINARGNEEKVDILRSKGYKVTGIGPFHVYDKK